MEEDVSLVGSRVSVMHLAYDCLRCKNTVAVSITDGKVMDGHRRLVQRPRECSNCGELIDISVAAEAPVGDRLAR